MFAVLAVIAFALSLLLHLIGGHAGTYVTSFMLGGLICVALHLAFGGWVPWVRRP